MGNNLIVYTFSLKFTKKNLIEFVYDVVNHHHTIIRAAFVCLCVRNQSPPRSFDGSSPNLVGVCKLTSHLPLRGSFSKRSRGRRVKRVTFAFHYIIYAPASRHTLQRRLLLCCGQAAESNSAPFPAVHLNAVCRCTLAIAIEGFFF